MTQFEMITSTALSGSGMCSISPLRKSTFARPLLRLFSLGQGQHLVGHVEAVGLAGRSDPPGREHHVDAAARAQVEHGLARLQFGQRGRVAAAQRGQQRRIGHFAGLTGVVQIEVIGSQHFASVDTSPQQLLRPV